MEQHEQRLGRESDRVLRWRQALTELADLQGFSYSACHYRNPGPESKLIDSIIEDVSRKLGVEQLFGADPPVGIKSRVHEQTVELFDYDVFLSFKGEDTGGGFTSYLYKALGRSKIRAFMHDTWIERGQVIERSRFALVIVSPHFASSRWCLDELVQIIECQKNMGQLVIPIFYEVDLYDVHYQRGTYVEAMKQHEQMFARESERVLQWRAALKELAKIQGFSYSSCQYRNHVSESELIGIIVNVVSRKLGDPLLVDANYPVGRESRVQELTDERFKHVVFLSYKGEDTGRGFTSYLYNVLRQIGSHAFMVETGIETGNLVSHSLLEVIEGSRIAIIICSLNYASSAWCLHELVKVMECKRTQAQEVIPIFYKVDPFDVRHQRGTYGEAMEQHEQRLGKDHHWVLPWRQALTELADSQSLSYSAYQYRNDGPESKLIENIVGHVSRKLGRGQLFVADHPVGRVHKLTAEGFNYDVFLSFRGKDTGNGFTSHLYCTLRRMGIHAFMDDARIRREEEITDSSLHVIERSRIVIVILSLDYAYSRWCLDELMKIMECQGNPEHPVVVPIFYEVDPSDVRHQRGTYGEAMKQHEKMSGRESGWVGQSRKALTAAANMAGFSSSPYR